MKKKIFVFAGVSLSACLFLGGCATVMNSGKSESVIELNSQVPGTNFVIRNNKGQIVSQGVAPSRVVLRRDLGYFERPEYTVSYIAYGYQEESVFISGNIAPSYIFGNFIFGGFLGWLVIDPLTGAMWRYEQREFNITPRSVIYSQEYSYPQNPPTHQTPQQNAPSQQIHHQRQYYAPSQSQYHYAPPPQYAPNPQRYYAPQAPNPQKSYSDPTQNNYPPNSP